MNTKWTCLNKGLRKRWHPSEVSGSKTRILPVPNTEVDRAVLEELLNQPKHYLSDSQFQQGYVTVTENVQSDEGTVLPAGVYNYTEQMYGPAYLEETDFKNKEAYIPLNSLQAVVTDIQNFRKHKAIYEEMNVSCRRGYLLHGPPGNGKTACIRNMLELPEFKDAQVIWCKLLPTDSFLDRLNATPNLKVFILEELTNERGDSNYQMSKLLEFLDGEHSVSNSIVIATTNYPELLAQNLADRPSRFDIVIKIGNPDAEAITKLFSFFLKRVVLPEEIVIKDVSVAHIKEIVLVHKIHGLTLQEAADKVKAQSSNFQSNFQEKKPFGL